MVRSPDRVFGKGRRHLKGDPNLSRVSRMGRALGDDPAGLLSQESTVKIGVIDVERLL